MRGWLLLLSGLLVWTVHFFGAYVIASLLPGSDWARTGVLLLTLACAVVLVTLLWRWRGAVDHRDEERIWQQRIAWLGAAVALLAVLWQGLPAII